MEHMKIPHSEFSILSGEQHFGDSIVTHLLHLAADELEPHEPDFANRFNEIYREKEAGSSLDWNSWYHNRMEDSLDSETKRMMDMLEQIKNALNKIDESQVHSYCRDMLVTDSYIGTEAKKGILKKMAMERKALYRCADEESSLDGYIGEHAIIIKPYERNHDDMVDELTHACTIYYKINDDEIELLYDFEEAS